MSDEVETVRGETLTIHFEGRRCVHARQCVVGRPDVFVANTPGEWIHPDAAHPELVASIARACPSGAIRYERHDGGPDETAPPVNVVRVRENGPLAFHGALSIGGKEELRATLCRCGQSKNKPYCDGSHTAAGFRATGELPNTSTEPLADRAGALTVTPAPAGPLLVNGNLEICTGNGSLITRTTKAAFCRCGASANKPFCDGSHRRIGFTGE